MTDTGKRPPSAEGLIAALATDPIAMLPVRIETRFFTAAGGTSDDGPVSELRVRIYPDALHAHAHVEAISPEEHRAGIHYWQQRDSGSSAIAWRTLLQRIPAPRAAWVVRSLTPTNLETRTKGEDYEFPTPSIHEAPWTEPPKATALPSRWILVGFRDGHQVYQGLGGEIPADLPLGPAPDPSTDDDPQTQDQPPDAQTDLAIDDGMRWLTDYDEALAVGMAITVTDDVVTGGLGDGFDRLLAIGVPEGNATTLARLFEAHHYTDGMAFVGLGTPTNNTADVPSGFDSADGQLAEALDPANPTPESSPASGADNGTRLAKALTLDPELLTALPGGAGTEFDNGAVMNALLWETTWGYFLDQYLAPRLDDEAALLMRSHFVEHVRGRGPLSSIRIGDQPYGILPAVSGEHFVPDGPVEARLHQLLGALTGLWGHASGRAPKLAKLLAAEADLVDILETTPNSTTVRARAVVGPVVAANTEGLSRFAAAGEATDNWLTEMILQGQRISGADYLMRPDARRLLMPFVTGAELSESEPLDPNYLTRFLFMIRRGGAFSAIQAHVEPAVLAILVRQAAQLELAKAAARLVLEHRSQVTGIPRPGQVSPLEPELLDFGFAIPNLAGFATAPYAPISGTQTMADYLATKTIEQLRADPDTEAVADFIDNLEAAAALPTAELDRLLAETLDLCSHRLDAWHTSLATKRLEALRADPSNGDYENGQGYSEGVHVGGFGLLHDVRPEPAPDSLGYVHAPSLSQATTAAVLRSAHLAARADGAGSDDPYAIDLSSERVRRALDIMDGVRSGLPLGAMLGYRFERAVREFDIELAQYILDFRRFAPLRTSTSQNDPGPLEELAARDVVDGRKLVEMWDRGRETFFDSLGFTVPNPHQDGLSVVLHRLSDDVDAVSDLLVAESVHQTIHGNTERSAAALDALDRLGPPPDPEVIKTPRSGFGIEHRLIVSLTETNVGPGWPATADPRAAAEPRLNSWVGRLLGDPTRVRFAAEVVNLSIEDPELQVVQEVEASLADLDISPLSVIWADAEGGTSGITELDERVARVLTPLVTPIDGAELELRLLESDQAVTSWPAGTIGLANLHTLAGGIRDIITGSAMVQPDDFVDPNDEDAAPLDLNEHQQRADAALAQLRAARATIEQLVADGVTDEQALDALVDAAGFGVGGALPGDPEGLSDQLVSVGRALARREAEADAGSDPAEQLRAVFGNGFVSLTRFAPPGAADLAASLADQPALTAQDPLAATTWLQQSSLVRPPTDAFHRVLANAEAIGADTGPTDLEVMQAPHQQGDRWVALPLADGNRLPEANVGLVIHRPGGFTVGEEQAGLVIDRWNESIPDPIETTGVSFHYDAPGTRAPQSILLAVPGDRSADRWTLAELVDIVNDTLTMAQVRAVDPQRLWMVNTALPAIYLGANSRGEGISTNLYEAEAMHRVQTSSSS